MNGLPFELNLDTWIISDTHWGHDNIVKFSGRPEDHDELMRELWIETVGRRDVVLHLGDLAYKGKDERVLPLLRGLPGEKYLLRGNHDKKTNAWYERLGFTVLTNGLLEEYVTPYGQKIRHTGFYWHDPSGQRILFSHYPDQRRFDWSTNVHGHQHNNSYSVGCPPDRDYRNVCVEITDYRPVRLEDVLHGEAGVHYSTPALLGGGWEGRI